MRSSPISRVRCATVMLNVLKIRNPPTSTDDAREHEQRRADRRDASAKSPTVLSTCSLPVRTANSRPELARDRGLELLGRRPVGGGHGDLVVAVVAGHALRLGRASSRPSARRRGCSTRRSSRRPRPCTAWPGVAPVTVTVSPSWKSYLSAVDLSSATSSSVCGGPPSVNSNGSKRSGGAVMASVGGPLETIGSPLRSSSVTSDETEPNASSTPSTLSTRLQRVRRHRRRLLEVGLDRLARLHRDVGALGGALEQVAERRVDRVRERRTCRRRTRRRGRRRSR